MNGHTVAGPSSAALFLSDGPREDVLERRDARAQMPNLHLLAGREREQVAGVSSVVDEDAHHILVGLMALHASTAQRGDEPVAVPFDPDLERAAGRTTIRRWMVGRSQTPLQPKCVGLLPHEEDDIADVLLDRHLDLLRTTAQVITADGASKGLVLHPLLDRPRL